MRFEEFEDDGRPDYSPATGIAVSLAIVVCLVLVVKFAARWLS